MTYRANQMPMLHDMMTNHVKILQGNETGEPPRLKRKQKLRYHRAEGHVQTVTYKKLFNARERPYYIYVTCSVGHVFVADIRDCEIVS